MPATITDRASLAVARRAAAPLRPGPALTAAWMLSAVVTALMVVESLLGLFVGDLYPEAQWAVASLRGNDLITLVLVAPVLAVALARAGRGASVPWALLWVAALLYNVYNFAYYVFGTAFNDVFLLHVATLSLSLLALILTTASLDVAVVAARAGWGRDTRIVAAFMALVGIALVAAWGGLSLRFAFTGELPQDVMPPEAVHLVYALDLSLLAPSFLLGAVLLWRRTAWGYALGVIVNAYGAAYLVVLTFVGGFQANAGIEGKTWWSWPSIVGALLCAAATTALLRHQRRT